LLLKKQQEKILFDKIFRDIYFFPLTCIIKCKLKGWSIYEYMGKSIKTLNAPSEFVKEWLETKYKSLIESTLSGLKNKDIKVEIVVGEKEKGFPQKIVINNLTLKKRYSFENFVVGGGNKLAYAASTAVAKNPGTNHLYYHRKIYKRSNLCYTKCA